MVEVRQVLLKRCNRKSQGITGLVHQREGSVDARLITQMGFPIAVAAWLLVKIEGKLTAAETAARELAIKLDVHVNRCIKCREGKPCRDCDRN